MDFWVFSIQSKRSFYPRGFVKIVSDCDCDYGCDKANVCVGMNVSDDNEKMGLFIVSMLMPSLKLASLLSLRFSHPIYYSNAYGYLISI